MNAILVNGDHNAHGVTYPNYVMFNYKNQNGNFTDLHNRMDKIKKNWTKFYSLVFNNTKNQIPVLPTFGNNDMVVHSQDNSPELNKYYYPLIFDIWFSKQDAKPVDPEPFFDGGYYRYDFENRDLSLLAMNTVMYMSGNREFTSAMQNQMDWLEKNLKENAQLPVESRKQFMISMHVFPGLNYFNHVEPLWLLKWQDKFLSILDTYGEQVIMIQAAHVHSIQLKNPLDQKFTSKHRIPIIITPSITPTFSNNPGYVTYSLEQKTEEPFFMPFNFKTSPIKTKSGMTKYSITNFKANFFQL